MNYFRDSSPHQYLLCLGQFCYGNLYLTNKHSFKSCFISEESLSKNIISIEELNKSFAEKLICKDNSFGIFANEKIGLVGINGCGKSTLLKLLIGIEPADSGNITFRKNIRVGYLPQIPQLDPEKTIYEEIYFYFGNYVFGHSIFAKNCWNTRTIKSFFKNNNMCCS